MAIALSDREVRAIREARSQGLIRDTRGALTAGQFRIKSRAYATVDGFDGARQGAIKLAIARFAGFTKRTATRADVFSTDRFVVDGDPVTRLAGPQWRAYLDRDRARGEFVLLFVATP